MFIQLLKILWIIVKQCFKWVNSNPSKLAKILNLFLKCSNSIYTIIVVFPLGKNLLDAWAVLSTSITNRRLVFDRLAIALFRPGVPNLFYPLSP
jgi:hypothetical protein